MTQNVSFLSKGEMLDAIKKHLNMPKNVDFARFLGISSQAVSNWYSRNTFDAELIYTKCDFINPAWLLTGRGDMIKEEELGQNTSIDVVYNPTVECNQISNIQENTQVKSPIKQRILLFLAEKGITQYEFYKETGVTRGVLAQNNGISEDNLSKFLAYFPDVSVEWLMTGMGNIYKERENLPIAKLTSAPNEGIPLIPFSAMAGVLTDESTILDYECERYIVPAFKGADFLISVKGNSMSPTYISGDIVACQRIPLKDLFFQWNKPYVLDTKQGALIKRIKPGSDTEHILIVSDNKEYEPFELSYQDINAVALVVGLIRLE